MEYVINSAKQLEQLFVQISDEPSVSDIFFAVNDIIYLRVHGSVVPTKYIAPSPEILLEFLKQHSSNQIPDILRHSLDEYPGEMDGAFQLCKNQVMQRFRFNYYKALDARNISQTLRISIRPLKDVIPAPSVLGIPDHVVNHVNAWKQGLILICGKTGQGKSTTLASLLQVRAQHKKEHIITLEQPIEYLLPSSQSIVSQREVGISTRSFANGLRAALRQNPDTILVGEIRDKETAEIALSASESGHLVMGTLHTSNAAQSIERFVNLFPTETQPAVWNVLSTALRMIMCQILVPSVQGKNIAVREILIVTQGISSYIKKQDLQGVRRGIEGGFAEYGMVNWARAAEQLLNEGIIDEKTRQQILNLV